MSTIQRLLEEVHDSRGDSSEGDILSRVSQSDLEGAGFVGELWPFQVEDVSKLSNVGAALIANEMGSGKSWEAIARDLLFREHAANEPAPPPNPLTLVVTPLSTFDGWEGYFNDLAPHLEVRTVDPKNRYKLLEDKEADVYIVHWEVLRLMPELTRWKFLHIIADEVHKAKNRKAKQTKWLKKIPAQYRTGLSGTPMVNRPDELWSILNWLYPKTFSSYWEFYNRYVDFEIVYPRGYHKVTGPLHENELKRRMAPFYVRHLKKEQCCKHHPEGIMEWLPEKYYREVRVPMDDKQQRAYDDMNRDMLAWIGEHENEPLAAPIVIAKLQRLQQFAMSFGELRPQTDGSSMFYPTLPSNKITALMDLLEDVGDEQIVVFSQFSKILTLTSEQLEENGYSSVLFTGSVSKSGRQANKQTFIRGDAQVLLGTIGAGGTGVEGLQQASSTVVFLDRDWSPANNQQAEDRLHRGGQYNAVQVIDIMSKGSVDMGRKQRLEMKWDWIKRVLNPEV